MLAKVTPRYRLWASPALSVMIPISRLYAGNTEPVRLFRLWRYSIKPYLRDCSGDRELPLHRHRDLRDPLAAVVACRLDHDAASRAVRSAGHSRPNATLDARRLSLADGTAPLLDG